MPKDPGNPQAGFYGSTIIADFDSREALDAYVAQKKAAVPDAFI